MNEWERLHQQAKRYQAEYPPGTRIMLLSMGRDPCPVEDQTRGTVKVVDDIGTLHCSFDKCIPSGSFIRPSGLRKTNIQPAAWI